MKLHFKLYKIMLIGLLPAIICMFLCIFFYDEYVLYSSTLLCALLIAILKIKKSFQQHNMILLNTFIALFLCSIVKGSTDNLLLPDYAIPMTLQIIIFCLSLLYITFPNVEKAIYKFPFYKVSLVTQVGSQIIVITSMLYILFSCLFFLFLQPIKGFYIFLLIDVIPPLIFVSAIIINYITVKSICKDYDTHPIIRVIGVNEGNILVSKRTLSCYQDDKFDTPIEDLIFDLQTIPERAKQISELTLGIDNFDIEPRFCIKYKSSSISSNKDVVLFILPIDNIKGIKLNQFKFVSPEEIKKCINRYSSYMKDEIDHLAIAAKIWQSQDNLTENRPICI